MMLQVGFSPEGLTASSPDATQYPSWLCRLGYNFISWCCNYLCRKCFKTHIFQELPCVRAVWTQSFTRYRNLSRLLMRECGRLANKALCMGGGSYSVQKFNLWFFTLYVLVYSIMFSLAGIFCHAFIPQFFGSLLNLYNVHRYT